MAFLDLDTLRTCLLVRAMPQVDPGTAVALRREAAQRTTLYPAELNVRPVEAVGAQRAPTPARQGDTPARPARMPIVTFLSIAQWSSVMASEFRVRVIARSPHAAIASQGQTPHSERANIRRPAAETYGSLFTLDPPDPYAIL